MSPKGPFRTGDLDAVLRDDLALDELAYGHGQRRGDAALNLLSAVVEDVEIRVPRRRHGRGRRLTRGIIITTVAATVLGATGVAAAQPGSDHGLGLGSLGIWSPRPTDHTGAAGKSLGEARRSMAAGRGADAEAALQRAYVELSQAPRTAKSRKLQHQAASLADQLGTSHGSGSGAGSGTGSGSGGKAPHPLPTGKGSGGDHGSWPWAWGIPGGGPGWTPKQSPYQPSCVVVVCTPGAGDTPGTHHTGKTPSDEMTLFRGGLPPGTDPRTITSLIPTPVVPGSDGGPGSGSGRPSGSDSGSDSGSGSGTGTSSGIGSSTGTASPSATPTGTSPSATPTDGLPTGSESPSLP